MSGISWPLIRVWRSQITGPRFLWLLGRRNMSSKPSGKAHFQVLGPCGEDNIPVLFLFTDSNRYVFNCSEGTQRLFTEYKVKLGKLENMFFTSLTWDHIGGLPGMAMTLRDIGRPRIGLYSPKGMKEILNACHPFLKHEKVDFQCTEFSVNDMPNYEDNQLVLKPIFLKSPVRGSPRGLFKRLSSKGRPRQQNLGTKIDNWMPRQSSAVVCYIGSFPKLPGKFLPGKALALGVKKGPMFGQLQRGQTIALENGNMVKPEEVMEPGEKPPSFAIIDCPSKEFIPLITTHKSFEDYKKDTDSSLVLMIHLMDTLLYSDSQYSEWINSFPESTHHWLIDKKRMGRKEIALKSQFRLCKHFHNIDAKLFPLIEEWKTKDNTRGQMDLEDVPTNTKAGQNLCRFHFRPLQVRGFDFVDTDGEKVQNQQVQAITQHKTESDVGKDSLTDKDETGEKMEAEDAKTNCEDQPVMLDTESPVTAGLGQYNGCQKELKSNTDGDISCKSGSCNGDKKYGSAESEILGKTELDGHSNKRKRCTCICAKVKKIENGVETECEEMNDIFSKRTKIETLCQCPSHTDDVDIKVFQKFPRIIFLGTGAALPSKYRNVTSILVQFEAGYNFMFDCGEGTYGQLLNHYGASVTDILRDLKGVFISHLHADHHLGLIRLLEHHTRMLETGNYDMDPLFIIAPGSLYNWLTGYAKISGRFIFRFISCHKLLDCRKGELINHTDLLPGICKVVTTEVDHGTLAYGIAMTHDIGWKLTYSGDTMPSENLIDIGKNSTVLIHEATLADELEEEAKEKHHSTLSQALEVSTKMNARYTLLTHFSQRYPKLPVLNDVVKDSVAVAFDHMEISIEDFARVATVFPKLERLFEDEEDS